MEDEIKATREAVGAVADLIKAAGDDPQVREAGKNLGQAAVTITKTINTALLPLAAINFAFDKAKAYFSGQFQRDLVDRTKDIPLGNIADPKASIAGPALQGIAFTHEEPNLKDMYLSLIATAMDNRVAAAAHPAFVEIIKQLEGEEAHLLRIVLRTAGSLPIVQVRTQTVGEQGWRVVGNHLMNLVNLTTGEPIQNESQPAMIDNWLRLGLVELRYDEFLMGDVAYAWVEKRPEYQRIKEAHQSEKVTVSYERGRIGRTAFGLKFAAAVGLLEDRLSPPAGASDG